MDDYKENASHIRQLGMMPTDDLLSHLSKQHENLEAVAPNISPHIHATALRAVQFLNSKLPQHQEFGLDQGVQPSKAEQNRWMELHDTVNNPLSVLEKVGNGTVGPHHIQALQAVYPDLHQEMIQRANDEMGKLKLAGKTIPYSKRVSLGILTGQPLDSTMTPQSMQAIMMSAAGNTTSQQGQPKQKKASGSELSQINKVTQMGLTPLQAREEDKKD